MNTTDEHFDHTQQAVLDETRKVNEQRMHAIKDLAGIMAEKVQLEDQLKDNARRQRQASKAAEKAGWTQVQIKRFMKPPKSQPPLVASDDNKADAASQQQQSPSIATARH